MREELELIKKNCTSENIDAVIEEVSSLQQDLNDLKKSYVFDYNKALGELPVRDTKINSRNNKYEAQIRNLEYLLSARDIYRQGWRPTATDKGWAVCLGESTQFEYCLVYKAACIQAMSFPTRELAEKFKEEFGDRMVEFYSMR